MTYEAFDLQPISGALGAEVALVSHRVEGPERDDIVGGLLVWAGRGIDHRSGVSRAVTHRRPGGLALGRGARDVCLAEY